MIRLYTTPSCSSCRKTKDWLEKHNINYVEKNLLVHKLTRDEVLNILRMAPDGTSDIISQRSNDFAKIAKKIDNMPLNTLADFIVKNPKVLKRPIICSEDGKKFYSGFNEDDIRIFLPVEYGVDEFIVQSECATCDLCDDNLMIINSELELS